MAAERNPDLAAFSIGFHDKRFDESRYAAAVCRRYQLRHHVRYCNHSDFMKYLDIWPSVMDDVVADPSAVMLTVVSEYAHEMGYKVILSGEGADELFGGYNQYFRFQLARRIAALGKYAPHLLQNLVAQLKPGQTRYLQFSAGRPHPIPIFTAPARFFEPLPAAGDHRRKRGHGKGVDAG